MSVVSTLASGAIEVPGLAPAAGKKNFLCFTLNMMPLVSFAGMCLT